ncbi:hypothetical protein NQ315_014241, partial [Exocentrus adspersus]
CIISSLVLQQITQHLRQSTFDLGTINIPNNIQLADPHFNKSGEMRNSNPLSSRIILKGLMHRSDFISLAGLFPLYIPNTFQNQHRASCVSCLLTTNNNNINSDDNTSLFNNQQLAAFWKVEEVLAPKLLNTEEAQCEKLFLKTTSRDNTGRFIVRLAFKENIYNLGDSYNIAKRRFLHLENKLKFYMQLKKCLYVQNSRTITFH